MNNSKRKNNAKQVIEKLQKEYLEASPRLLESLAGANKALKKNFSRFESFLMEFIQNAEDEGSSFIRFELRKDSLRVINDGKEFIKKHVNGICGIGVSPKRTGRYIGYLGVGFKSVFLISDAPEIHSGSFHFKFDHNKKWPGIKSDVPYEILPIWVEEPPSDIDSQKTTFILPAKRKNLKRIGKEFSKETISSRTILFIKNIRKIEMVDLVKGTNRTIIREPGVKKSGYRLEKVIERENGGVPDITEWIVVKKRCKVPARVQKDETTIEWDRHEIKTREVSAAFKINDGVLEEEDGGTIHIGLFSFLPIKEEVEGFNYILQGDFLTGAGRESLARDNLWNNWLADELAKLVEEQCIPIFLRDEKWKMNFTKILFSREGGHQLIDKRIKRKINRYMENNNVLITKKGVRCSVKDAAKLKESILHFFSDEELSVMFPDKKVLHSNCETPTALNIYQFNRVNVMDMARSNSQALLNLLKIKTEKKDVEFFLKLYDCISETCGWGFFYPKYNKYNVEHDRWMSSLTDSEIILTNRFELSPASSTFIQPENLEIPEELHSGISVVHPGIADQDTFLKFRDCINEGWYRADLETLEVLNKEIIEDLVDKKITEELDSSRWENLSGAKKLKQIIRIKELWDEYDEYINPDFDITKYDYLTLKTKSNKWMRPSEIVFSTEYEPEHELENLCELGYYDTELQYLSSEYLPEDVESKWGAIDSWREFFLKLGVDDIVQSENKQIIERIAILTAIKFEEDRDRIPTEIGQSEKKKGDVKSKGQGEERMIEVKGTAKKPEEYVVELRKNQTKNILEHKSTHLYIVCETFSKPRLFSIESDTIIDIADWNIIVSSGKWNNREVWEDSWTPI
jgi:hypothetical protein